MADKEGLLTQDEFEEWCGSHSEKGCGKTKDMCETICRLKAQRDLTRQATLTEVGELLQFHSLKFRMSANGDYEIWLTNAQWQALKEGKLPKR